MSLSLSDFVVCGEIDNLQHNRVSGRLRLAGVERPVTLLLTGNCANDLTGQRVRFAARASETRRHFDLPSFSTVQVGPTECLTAARRTRPLPHGVSEFSSRTKIEEFLEKSGDDWQRCLHLTWLSQNGRVIVELVDPIFEVLERAPVAVNHEELGDPFEEALGENIPNEEEIALRLRNGWNGGERVRLRDLVRSSESLPRPDELNDHAAEQITKFILADLALYAVAIDVCEHCTPSQLYRVLVERILHEAEMDPEQIGSGVALHYSTHAFCKHCAAQVGF